MKAPKILIMAGGTGGHIMPGLAVAEHLRASGWDVYWLGNPERMEGELVPAQGIELLPLYFNGVRGKGLLTLLRLPFALFSALLQARKALRKCNPDVVLGMGGYVAFPGGVVARLSGVPLIIHEQNAVAGTANKFLAKIANRTLAGFPGALSNAIVVGNPVRAELCLAGNVNDRYKDRTGPLNILVLGGSQGAASLNKMVPEALSISTKTSLKIKHQCGAKHYDSVVSTYKELKLQAEIVPFIDDMAAALKDADLVICRAGAMTVAEVAAVGVAAVFIPLPGAIDDHQTANARYLSECGGGWLMPQVELTSQKLGNWISAVNRAELAQVAVHAQEHASLNATQLIAEACMHTVEEKE